MNSEAYANSIVLQIDEANRSITNNGKNTPIVLGVKGDDCAERVYFESPTHLSPEINLLDKTEGVSVRVYVNYKNASNEPYIQECTDVVALVGTDKSTFSWLVTNRATNTKGDVKFNICIKKFVNETLTNEWHTTTFIGKVLESVDVTAKTPEVITHDTVTLQALTVQVQDYASAVVGYGNSVNNLIAKYNDVEEVINESVDAAVVAKSGVKYLGVLNDELEDTKHVIEPGVYTFNRKGSTNNSYYVMVVCKNILGAISQSIYCNFSSMAQFYYYRYTENEGVTWTNPTQKVFAYESDLPQASVVLENLTTNIPIWTNVGDASAMGYALGDLSRAKQGDKLRLYFGQTAIDEYANTSFIVDIDIINTNRGTAGQASHHVFISDAFEGMLSVKMHGENTYKQLFFSVITKMYNATYINNVYGSNGLKITLNKIELITGSTN